MYWQGTSAVCLTDLINTTPQWIRDHRWDQPIILDMGWHVTWMGDAKAISTKAHAVSENGYVENPLFNQEDLFSQLYQPLALLLLTPFYFPQFVIEHQDELRQRGLLEELSH